MSFYNKVKWALGILIVFALIVATNLIDRNNFLKVKDSTVSIYEDRLVAKELIFDMAEIVHDKELALVKSDSLYIATQTGKVNQELENLIARFKTTTLTYKEEKCLTRLEDHFNRLKRADQAFTTENRPAKLDELLGKLHEDLRDLSGIQMKEGKRQVSITNQAIDAVELFTQLEIYILIFLAIAIQIIIIYQPRDKKDD